jgi:hypothetical protein
VYGSAAPAIEPGGAAQQFGKCAAEVGAAPDDVTVVAVIAQGQIGCLQGLDDSRAAGFLPDVEMIEPRDQLLLRQRLHLFLETAHDQDALGDVKDGGGGGDHPVERSVCFTKV